MITLLLLLHHVNVSDCTSVVVASVTDTVTITVSCHLYHCHHHPLPSAASFLLDTTEMVVSCAVRRMQASPPLNSSGHTPHTPLYNVCVVDFDDQSNATFAQLRIKVNILCLSFALSCKLYTSVIYNINLKRSQVNKRTYMSKLLKAPKAGWRLAYSGYAVFIA